MMSEQAVAAVARGWGGSQVVSGPVLAIPVTWKSADGKDQSSTWYVLADTLHLDVEMIVQAERRKLGINEVPVYVTKVRATGQFDLTPVLTKPVANAPSAQIHFDRSRLLVPINDLRGVRQIETTTLTQGRFEPVTGFPQTALNALIRMDVDLAHGKQAFDLTFEVAGTQSLAFIPLAHVSRIQLKGNWPDPGFAQGFLPVARHVRGSGYDAAWPALDLNRPFATDW